MDPDWRCISYWKRVYSSNRYVRKYQILTVYGCFLKWWWNPKNHWGFPTKKGSKLGVQCEMGRFSQPFKDSTTITCFKTKVTWDQGCECPFGPSQVFGVRRCCGTKREPIVCWFPRERGTGFLNKFIQWHLKGEKTKPFGKEAQRPVRSLKLYLGVSKNRCIPKWMAKIMENPIKMDDLGVPPF